MFETTYVISGRTDGKPNNWPEEVPIIFGGDRMQGFMQVVARVTVRPDNYSSLGFRVLEVDIVDEAGRCGAPVKPGDMLFESFVAYCEHQAIADDIGELLAREMHDAQHEREAA